MTTWQVEVWSRAGGSRYLEVKAQVLKRLNDTTLIMDGIPLRPKGKGETFGEIKSLPPSQDSDGAHE